MSQPQNPPSLKATLPEGVDATAQIIERLRAHGAKHSRYRERNEVARGGMGMILRVWDEDLRRELAMKVVLGESGQATTGEIPPKVLGRFLEEAQVTGQLDHPGIVPVHELGLDERGAVFFTMRLVKGRDLKEIFELVHAKDPEWTLTRALWALLKACDALAYAHSKGVIHRDLKPANIMVGRFGEVYVMDWGLARVLGHPDRHDLRLRREDSTLSYVQSERRADVSHSADSVLFTMDGDVVGTPAYMAPEQARGEIESLGPRTDVYAMGAILYHLLTGEMPYVTPGARVSQHMVLRWTLDGPPRSMREIAPDVPDELVAICEKAMARKPEARYADTGALGEDLRAYLENRVVKAHRRGAWVELVKWVQRNRALAIAWSAALLVALAGLAATAFVQVRGRRVAEQARGLAQTNEIEARRQAEIARAERSNVLRLSAGHELQELVRAADELWPAVPTRVADMQAWLARARRLIAGLEPGAGGDPGHRRQLETLRGRALPLSDEERARALAASPHAAALDRAEREVRARSAAEAVRAARAQPPEVELGPATSSADGRALNARAFPLVDPVRTEFGREGEGLALARLALERIEEPARHLVLDTLAWASFANGLDEEALAASRAALDAAPARAREEYQSYLLRLAHAVQLARAPGGDPALAAARARLAGLERQVFGATLPRFEDEDDRWWFGQLEALVRSIEDFADPLRGLVEGTAPPHGWGVARRIEFARDLEARTLSGPDASARWAALAAELRDPALSSIYHGLELAPQLGLLPLGRDPASGLQEFADVATGEPPRRLADGRLELLPGSSVVFVLLPGSALEVGAQASDPAGANFDRAATENERPVNTVQLAPFFLSKYELTQGQWTRFNGGNPSRNLAGTFVGGKEISDLAPVERVSWQECVSVLGRLGWALPTEAQWEYACRARTTTPWWAGDDIASLAGVGNLSDRAARGSGAPWTEFEDALDDGYFVEAPVGSFEPNRFGLHDTLGNVFEWCREETAHYGLPVAPGDGARLGGNPDLRTVRGGAYNFGAGAARSARRHTAPPDLQNESIGLRPMRPIDPPR